MFKLFEMYKSYVVVFLVCALAVTILSAMAEVSWLRHQLKESEATVTRLKTENGLLTAANSQMAVDLAAQNKAVKALKEAEGIRSVAAEREIQKVIAERDKWRDRYVVLFSMTPAIADEPEALAALINQYYLLRAEEKKR